MCAQVEYREKHYYCKAKIGLSDQSGHQDYIISKPGQYLRCQNEQLDQKQNRGILLEFWNNNKMKNSYWE
jgi:hypothetical protein